MKVLASPTWAGYSRWLRHDVAMQESIADWTRALEAARHSQDEDSFDSETEKLVARAVSSISEFLLKVGNTDTFPTTERIRVLNGLLRGVTIDITVPAPRNYDVRISELPETLKADARSWLKCVRQHLQTNLKTPNVTVLVDIGGRDECV